MVIGLVVLAMLGCRCGDPDPPAIAPEPVASEAVSPPTPAALKVEPAPAWAEDAFGTFAIAPLRRRGAHPELAEPAAWDRLLVDRFARTLPKLAVPYVFAKLERAVDEYAFVLRRVRARGLPEAIAAIPYQESYYQADRKRFPDCATGIWQLAPGRAREAAARAGLPMRIEGCPEDRCGRGVPECTPDDRTDLARSTAVALSELSDAWDAPAVGGSASGVIATILSYPLGRAEVEKTMWTYASKGGDPALFAGANMTCTSPMATDTCGGLLRAEAQVYPMRIVGLHAVAACYYGRHHADRPEFAPYAKLPWCSSLPIPASPADPADAEPSPAR